MDLAVHCYEATASFPSEEKFGLVSQMRRASSSVAANIAEGHGRETSGAFVQGLRIAQGSLKELETHVTLCTRVRLMDELVSSEILRRCDELGRMLRALIRSLQDTK